MALLCFFSSLILLAWIAIQDFRERMVYWVLFPMIAVSSGMYSYLKYLNSGRDILVNFSYILIVGLLVIGYLMLKNNEISNIFNEYLGIGDVLFFGVIAVTLPSVVFAMFFVFSLIVSLIFGLTIFKGNTIPLAGCQAILLGALISLFHFNIISVWDIEKLIML